VSTEVELSPLVVAVPQAAPVAVTDVTDLLELVARLLPLRLRFLIPSVLKDRGRVIPWSFCRGETTGFSMIHIHC